MVKKLCIAIQTLLQCKDDEQMHIPLKTLLTSSGYSYGHFLAKSGICFKSEQTKNYIYGFGFNEDKEKAIMASKFEALERLYATNAFHQNIKSFEGYSFEIPNRYKTFLPSEVLISNTLTPGEKSADANGLGCHQDLNYALNHAILELIERHLLAEIWYGNDLVYEIEEKTIIRNDGWHIRFYTSFCFDVPFVIAVLTNFNKNIWILGSALRESFLQSLEHAKNEAFMLLESAFLEDGIAYSEDVEKRLSSLKNIRFSQARERFFRSKTSNKNVRLDVKKKYLTREIICETLGDNPIWIVPLLRNKYINVIRVVCDSAKNPRWLRGSCSAFLPTDPFC